MIKATRFVRKMRGGAQSQLLAADDGHSYVVKFQNNPQHQRILINEWVAGELLTYMQIATPRQEVIELTSEFLDSSPDVCITLGSRRIAVAPGKHYASRFPGDPEKLAVYDFIPDTLLMQVINRSQFLGALVFDTWTGQADCRQAVFYRDPNVGFLAKMIDNGFAFNGPHWDFPESKYAGIYTRRAVYGELVRSEVNEWIERCLSIPRDFLYRILESIPDEWISYDSDALSRLLDRLWDRREYLANDVTDKIEHMNCAYA